MVNSKRLYLIPFLGFLLIIIVSSFLLYLPICNNEPIRYWDAIFVATSGVSTTGLSTVVIANQFNFLGQLIIAILLEIGAFGFIVIISYIWSMRNKKISMNDMILINDNISNSNDSLMKEHLLFIGTFMLKIQTLGVLFYSFKFIPMFGFFSGIWYSIFHSISAFSNGGIDIVGPAGFRVFDNDLYVQLVTMILMFLGSIGILVLEDIKNNRSKNFGRLNIQSQIVIVVSIFIIILPTIIFVSLEKNISILEGLFTSITTRSTGLSVVDIKDLTIASKIIIMVLMLIGGGPASTSGGIKIVPFIVALSTIVSTLKGQDKTIIFNKKISDYVVKKAFTIITIFIGVLFITCSLFYLFNNIGAFNIAFESVSAITNTGLTITDLNHINLGGEIILISLMLIGRVGPLSMILILVKDDRKFKFIDYPEANIII